jgi:hypothetical protein
LPRRQRTSKRPPADLTVLIIGKHLRAKNKAPPACVLQSFYRYQLVPKLQLFERSFIMKLVFFEKKCKI